MTLFFPARKIFLHAGAKASIVGFTMLAPGHDPDHCEPMQQVTDGKSKQLSYGG